MKFVNKHSIVSVEQMSENFTLLTFSGEEYGCAGDWVGTHSNGDKEVIPQEVFDEDYVAVELVETNPTKQLSHFEEQYYQNTYNEMSKLDQEEDKKYIENMRKLVENKPF